MASLFLLRRLLALARDLLQAPDLRAVLGLVGPALQELLGADEALLLVTLGEREYVTGFDQRGLLHPARHEDPLYAQARRALDDRTPLVLPAVTAGPAGQPGAVAAASLLAFPFPPIEPMGVLAALWYRRGREHQLARQIPTLRHISELTGAALGNIDFRLSLEGQVSAQAEEIRKVAREHAAEMHRRDDVEDELHRIAITDVLTGMLNRRGFFLQAEHGLKLARRQGLVAAVISADVDGLKMVNDQLGHDVGDRLIQTCAQILKSSLRDSDVVARLGGDEFAAFTLDAEQPQVILARIRQRIEEFHRNASTPYRVGFSIGIVQCQPSGDTSLADYLAMADEQMYAHKKGQAA